MTNVFDALKKFGKDIQRLNQELAHCKMQSFFAPSQDGRLLVAKETLSENANDVEATAMLGLVELAKASAINKLIECSCGRGMS